MSFDPAATDSRIGTTIDGRYRIDAQIGIGGMATVYRATRLLIGDEVAVKVLHAQQLREPAGAERFRREAQAAARLKHANAVTIHDFGISTDGVIYLVMELVAGQSLRDLVKERGRLAPSLVADILAKICSALGEAHRQQIVHRDIKPDNIVVSVVEGQAVSVKVLDFGIARINDVSMEGHLTQTGNIIGTPSYMSPEQCLGEELDGRSDIYSLGIVAYEMLTGEVPFKSPTSMAVALHHINTTPAPLTELNASIPTAVGAEVLKALEKRREARPQTATDFSDAFSTALRVAVASLAVTASRPNMMPTVEMSVPWEAGKSSSRPPSTSRRTSESLQPSGARRISTTTFAILAGLTVVTIAAVSYSLSRDTASTPPVPAPVKTANQAPPIAATSSPAPVSVPPTSSAAPAGAASAVATAPPSAPAPGAGAKDDPGPAAPTFIAETAEPRGLTPGRGDVTIRTLPGTAAQLDGAAVGTAGPDGVLLLQGLRPGRHSLRLLKERFRDVEQTLMVVAGRSDVIEIQPVPLPVALSTTTSIAPVGEAPKINDLSTDRSETTGAEPVTLRVSAVDADSLKYHWAASSGTIEGQGPLVTFRPAPAGERDQVVTVTVTARNSLGLEARKEIGIRVKGQPLAPEAMRRRAYAVGAHTEIWLESPAIRAVEPAGVVEAELQLVQNVWQITTVRGNLPGVAVSITPECRNCELVGAGVVESPNPVNAFRRVRIRVKPLDSQQSITVLLRYQAQPAKKR